MGAASSRFVQKNIDSLVGLGLSRERLMPCIPGGDSSLGDPTHRFDAQVLIDVFELAETLSDDPAVGFRCGLNHGHAVYSDIAYTILYCRNLKESFDISVRFEPLTQQYGENSLIIRGNEADIVWTTEDTPERLRHISDLSFATLARLGLWMKAVHGLSVKKMQVRHQDQSYKALYESMFDCPIIYGAPVDILTFDKRFLELPLPGSNPQMLSILIKRLERDLSALEQIVTDDKKVTAYLEKILGTASPTIDYIANLMGVTARTLRRRLTAQGTSFRKILESVRRERYEILSRQPELSQVQIAAMLGYSEQSAFSRAYRKWHGASPKNNM